jgi:hypothetical protein
MEMRVGPNQINQNIELLAMPLRLSTWVNYKTSSGGCHESVMKTKELPN